MRQELPPLPYPKDALEPHISADTVDVHYEKHHRGYLKKLEALLENDPRRELSLEQIMASAAGPVFDNAAQVWNHSFYWQSMKPTNVKASVEHFVERLPEFHSKEDLFGRFTEVADHHFGSGYVWLSATRDGEGLVLEALPNAQNPLTQGLVPLLCLDLWEHAYYLDRRNDRAAYVKAFLEQLANWDFAQANLRTVRVTREHQAKGRRG